MRKIIGILLIVLLMCGCTNVVEDRGINASEYGLHPDGGICAENETYQACISLDPLGESVHFEDCRNCFFE